MKKLYIYIALLLALVSTLGSLYFSEILHFTPCILCWYQRICMYPLIILLAVGILRKDTKVYLYALPLAIIGAGVALFQNLLQYHIIAESISPCSKTGVSCTTQYINLFGFITIPLLSLLAFLGIIVALFLYAKTKSAEKE